MVKLRALDISSNVCHWVTVWRGDSLRDLDKKDFAIFKRFYFNLKLSFCYYDDEDDNNYYDYDYDDDDVLF